MRTIRIVAAAALLAAPGILPAQAGTPETATGIRKELIGQLDDAEQKLVALCNAMPADKFIWRPGPGVRSVSEVFMHVVESNLSIPGIAGVAASTTVRVPPGADTSLVNKARIADFLTRSFEHTKNAVMAISDAQMDTKVNLFGQPSTKRGVMVLLVAHAHEHLGQAIAYARMNGVVPPWSK
jgi:uncharacterized damage-inducible protein DinB